MSPRKEHKLARRDAELAKHIAFRNRADGDQTVKSCSIRFANLMLDQPELADLTQEPLAGRALFCKRAGSVLDEPLFKTLGAIPVTTHLTGRAFLYSTLGQDEIDLGVVSITNLKLEPKTGGMTALAGVIQATPVLDGRVAEFIDRMGTNVQLALSYEHEAEQQELPMGGEPAGSDDDENDAGDETNGSSPPEGYDQRHTIETRDGAKTELRSGKEIDDELRARNPDAPTMGDAAKAGSYEDIGPKTREEIAKAANRRGRRAIDGRKGAH